MVSREKTSWVARKKSKFEGFSADRVEFPPIDTRVTRPKNVSGPCRSASARQRRCVWNHGMFD